MAWFRTLQLLDGIGPASAARILDHVASNMYDPVSLNTISNLAYVAAGNIGLCATVQDTSIVGTHSGRRCRESNINVYRDLLKKLYENAEARLKDLENLQQIATRYETRRKFLVDLQLDPPASTSDIAGPPGKDEDWLVLSTIHSAKGCEWDVVYLIHAADGFLPSDMSTGSPEEIEEELRLTYVAMTRAKDHLYVSWPPSLLPSMERPFG